FHCADEDAAAPLRKLIARVERQARGGDCRNPDEKRLLDSRQILVQIAGAHGRGIAKRDGATDVIAGIVIADTYDGPAIIRATLEVDELVVLLRAVFVLPDISGGGIHGHAEDIAIAHGIDLRPIAGLADEGIVLRHAAVAVEAQDLTIIAAGILCPAASGMDIFPRLRRGIRRAGGDIELAIPAEHDPHAGVLGDGADAVVQQAVIDEYVVDVRQLMAVPNAARDGIGHGLTWTCWPHDGGRCTDSVRHIVGTQIGAGLVVSEINVMIPGKVGIESDIEQSIDPYRVYGRHARDGGGIEHAVTNDAQATGPFGDQD